MIDGLDDYEGKTSSDPSLGSRWDKQRGCHKARLAGSRVAREK